MNANQPVNNPEPCQAPGGAGAPVIEYNANRLELMALFSNVRRWLMGTDNAFRQSFEAEMRTIFREFARAYPTAGLSEIDAVQLCLRLQAGGQGAESEYAQRIAPHQALVIILRRLRDYTNVAH